MQVTQPQPRSSDSPDQRLPKVSLGPVAADLFTQFTVLPTVDSTNDWLWRQYETATIHGMVCLADQQTAGRGRGDRVWTSTAGSNLTFSFGWSPDAALDLGGLSLIIGRSLVRALRSVGVDSVGLKWPNDLLVAGGKLGGVLTEIRCRGNTRTCVIGVGINVALDAEDTGLIDRPWCDLMSLGVTLERNDLLAVCLNQLALDIEDYNDSLQQIVSEWPSLSVHYKELVDLHLGNKTITGVDLGIDELGRLLIKSDDGVHAFAVGETSLRINSTNNR